ncbi:MAG: entericidin A/B family lipoprotein [Deltaproteobacteria bacterium]|nr:entericidin A/B family lipoprotein [Deltaproteobacteria bacterium]
MKIRECLVRMWVVLLLLALLAGCNTFKGMGRDIEGAGQAIERAADKTKEAIKK